METTSQPFALYKLTALPARFAALSLLVLALAACGSPAAAPTQAAPSATVEAAATPVPTIEPTTTQTPTDIPHPQISLEQLTLTDASIGSFIQDEQGNLIYNSPLYNTDVGKNIAIVQQYREVGLDGGPEIWLVPEKYPNAPIVIQDLDTSEIRQGPFRYDNDVRRRLTVPASADYISRNPQLRVFQGTIPLAGMMAEVKDPGYWDVFGISAVLVSDQTEKDGHLVMGAKSYIGTEEDMLAFDFDVSLGPIDAIEGTWEPFYSTYIGENKHSYFLDNIRTNKGNFRGRYTMFSQILIAGFVNVNRDEPSIANQAFGENAFYSAANNDESSAILSVLKNNGLPEELSPDIAYEDLSLYGVVLFVFR